MAPLQAKVGIGKVRIIRNAKEYCFERIWTPELLEWRIKNPYHPYQISGNNIYAPTNKYGIKAIMGDFKNEMLIHFKSHPIASVNPLKLWMGIDPSVVWKGSMYFEIPQKMRPSPLNLIFKDLTSENRILEANAVKFRAIDFDAY